MQSQIKMAKLLEVSVKVIQAKHLQVEANASTQVEVNIGEKYKYTKVIKYSDSPYFDEYFTFDYKLPLDDVLEKNVKFRVKKYRGLLSYKKTVADFTLSLRDVWLQPGHQIHRKWAALLHPTNLLAGPQGYLKVDILVLHAGELAPDPIQLDPEEEDYIEGNLILQREGTITSDRQFAEYTVQVYRADGIPKLPSSLMSELRRVVGGEKTKESISPLICIRLSDLQGRTSVQNSRTPIWNESLTFTESFPPMWSNVRVQLHNYSSLGSTVLAEHCIPLSGIAHLSKAETNNFAPTFGPAFVELFTELGKHAGRVLLSIKTKIIDMETLEEPPVRRVTVAACEPCPEKTGTAEMALFVSLLEANLLSPDHADHKLSLQVCFGTPSQGSLAQTPPQVALAGDERLCSLPVGEITPCVSTVATWPDRRHSMFARNRLNRIAKLLEGSLGGEGEGGSLQVQQALEQMTELCDRALATLRGPNSFSSGENNTPLDSLRAALRRASLEEINSDAIKVIKDGTAEDQVKMVQDFAVRLRLLADDPQQNGMPSVCVQLVTEAGRLLAEHHISCEEIVYTMVEAEQGPDCLRPVTVFMQAECESTAGWGSATVAKVRLLPWLGLAKEVPACLQKLPAGCIRQQEVGSLFPSALRFTQKQVFECRAHIYQGSFVAGWDKSSLCDPFIRVSCGGRTCCTKVIHETLSPTWDQTLVLWPVVIWGSIEAVVANPPFVTLEALDLDVGKAPDYIGRTTAIPKVQELQYKDSAKLPTLKWYTVKRGISTVATILSAFELVQCSSLDQEPSTPQAIRPRVCRYRLECLFWGIRSQNKVERPRIQVECLGQFISSTIISNALQHGNFEKPHSWIELELPSNPSYLPPVTIKLFNHRNLCQPFFEGTCMVPSLRAFLEVPLLNVRSSIKVSISPFELGPVRDNTVIQIEPNSNSVPSIRDTDSDTAPLLQQKNQQEKKGSIGNVKTRHKNTGFENAELDWWSKLMATESKVKSEAATSENSELAAVKIKLYDRELEAQPEFHGFTDLVRVFSLVKGHRVMDENPPEIASFKGGFNLRPLGPGEDCESLRMTLLPPPLMSSGQGAQQPTRVLARLYIVRGLRLRPKDADGLSDPYISISTSLGQRVRDRENFIRGDLNPVFGKCYELELSLPQEHEIVIGIVDRDDSSSDDLIGETRIDIERRLMSRHRAHCGISARYDRLGYNMWREGELPSQVLESLCSQYGLPLPQLSGSQITVGPLTVQAPPQAEATGEQLALAVLRRWEEVVGWPLVPEHLESRPLFLPRKPGVEQGRLQMWLDLFPERGSAPGLPVNIAPRTPVAYELRVIVWNAEEIPLDDVSITGEKMSDIFFKGWVGEPMEQQATDVHYRSLTGEGQFNWRMVFPLRYLAAERRMVIQSRRGLAGLFAKGEQLIPCTLSLQVWDADLISADDFIGRANLELCRLPPGAKSSRSCELRGAEAGPPVNLFVTRRTRGWWPLRDAQGGSAGKVELELEIMRVEEAKEHPVGRGRDPPEALPPPNRPDTSFLWLLNPARAAKGIIWKRYGKKIVCFMVLGLILFLLLSGLFVVPELLVKKLFTFWT